MRPDHSVYRLVRLNEGSIAFSLPAFPATRSASKSETSAGSRATIATNAATMPVRMIAACSVCVRLTARAPPDVV